MEKKYAYRRRTKSDGKRLNMYPFIDFTLFRGMTTRIMTDAEGDEGECICIPVVKNLISTDDKKYRMFLAVRKCKKFKGAPYVMCAQSDANANDKFLAEYKRRYLMISPKIGGITYDLDKLEPKPFICSWSRRVIESTKEGLQTGGQEYNPEEMLDSIIGEIDEITKDR